MNETTDFDVITVGEPMALFMARSGGALETVQDFRMTTAGAELNVAIGLARLGLRVCYLSRVGDDVFGRVVLDTLARERVSRAHVAIVANQSTGFMLKSLALDGADPEIDYYRRGSAASGLSVADGVPGLCARARHLHLTGISPALSDSARELVFHLAREARAAGRRVSFDPNLRPRLWPSGDAMRACVNELATLSDLMLPGLAEGRILTGFETPGDIARFYLDRGARQVVVKLGAAGAYCASADGGLLVPAAAVAGIVDTVGAGDGFAAGVISALLEGEPLGAAVVRGNAIGARVIQFPGDSDGLPTRSQLGLAERADLA